MKITNYFPGNQTTCVLKWRTLEDSKAEIGDLQNPSGVDEAIARLEVSVEGDVAVVKVNHALEREISM